MQYKQTINIIGGGIMGLLSGHRLREALPPDTLIALCEKKGFPPKNASAMAGGMLAPYSEIEHLPPEFLPAALAGLNFWAALPQEKTGFQKTGSLILCHPLDTHILKRFENHLKTHKLEYKSLDKLGLHELEIADFPNIEEGLLIESEAHINPQLAMHNLIEVQRPRFADNFDIAPHPEFDWIIDCRGIDANDPDLRGVKGETLVVYNPNFHLKRPVRLMHPRYPLYIVPRHNNIFVVGASMIESSDNTSVSVRSAMELMSALQVLSPSFAEASIVEINAGIRPAYPDNLPRIKIDHKKRIISCNGLFRHGYLLAPVMAACVADFIAGKDNQFMSLFERTNDADHHQRAA